MALPPKSDPHPHKSPVTGSYRWASLERRLPLMISALLAVTIAAFGVLAYTELRQSSIAGATTQLRTLISQTVDNANRTVAQRASSLQSRAASPIILRAVNAGASNEDRVAAMQLLASRRAFADTLTLVSQVLIDAANERYVVPRDSLTGIDAAGERPLPKRHALTSVDAATLDSTIARVARSDSAAISSIFAADSAVRYWVVAPVRNAGKIVGFAAEQRRIVGSANIEQQIKDLTGQDLSVYFTSSDGSLWTGVRGAPLPAKFDVNTVPDSFHLVSADGETLIGAKAKLRGMPLVAVFSIKEASVNARALAFLRRMILVGTLLLGTAVLVAWWVSRRVTAPLKSLTVAARQVARGDYAVRERIRTNDELGELANAFNGMAERIGVSHAQLGVRIEESETLARALYQASAAKSEFLAMMSHELRTPLSAIAGYAEILQLGMRGPLNEAQQLDLSRIQANQAHLLRIINDILDIAQVESGQMQLSLQSVSMRDVLDDLDPIVLPLVRERGVVYTVHDNVIPLVVTADRDRLTQVFVNLVANATRFTPSGGSISIHAAVMGSTVRLHVVDSGIGIPPEKQEAVFQPFVQVESGASRRAQGTGLGLAISRRIVESMGGTLTLNSAVGVGSTFTMELNLPTSALLAPPNEPASTAASGRRVHAGVSE